MVGLPTETEDDVFAIPTLVKKIKGNFSQPVGKRGTWERLSSASVRSFPSPLPRFKWAAMDPIKNPETKNQDGKGGIENHGQCDCPCRPAPLGLSAGPHCPGDRRVADILVLANENRGNWPQTFKASPIDPHFYVLRERDADERFPWDFIDSRIDKSYLWREYQRALDARTSAPCPADPARCSICGVCEGARGDRRGER